MPASIIAKFSSRSPLIRRVLVLSPHTHHSSSLPQSHHYSTAQTQKLERIADEFLSLNQIELANYNILWRLKLGYDNSVSLAGLGPATSGAQNAAGAAADGDAKTAEKTTFNVKLEKFDTAAKIKIIKELRSFTDLGLKEAKDLVEKAPTILKSGVTKEEGNTILEKLKNLGATVILE